MIKVENTDTVISKILMTMESTNLIPPAKLCEVKMALEMHLVRYQLTYEDETGLSVDIDMTADYLNQFWLDMALRGCSQSSIASYKCDLKNCLLYIDKNVNDITCGDIQRYMAFGKLHRGWKDTTYNTKRMSIRTFFRFLYEEDLISSDPSKKLKIAKVEHKIGPTISAYQQEEIKCACETEKELALINMLYSTGARISELLQLNITDIDFQRMSAIVYGKGRKEREIYFTAPAKLHLQRYLDTRTDDNPALFVASRKPHGRISKDSVRAILRKIKKRDQNIADIALTPHVFRRSVGTDMINHGAPLELVAEKLGHVQLDTTKQCYAKISRETVRQAHDKYVR